MFSVYEPTAVINAGEGRDPAFLPPTASHVPHSVLKASSRNKAIAMLLASKYLLDDGRDLAVNHLVSPDPDSAKATASVGQHDSSHSSRYLGHNMLQLL